MLDDLTRDLLDPATPFTLAKLQTLERHITNIYSNEVSRVTESNLILTQLKQQDSIIINIQTLLEHATLDRTKFYVLVTFEQRLEAIWPGLNPAYRQSLRQYFVGLFMKFTRVSLNSETRPISKTVTSIMVKMFLIGYEQWPSFIQDLMNEAKSDQGVCDAVMTAFGLLADNLTEYKTNNQRPQLQMFLQPKLHSIVTLCIMVIEATTSNKLKQHLLKSTLQLLDRFLLVMAPEHNLPIQTISTLLQLLKTNVFRDLVAKLLTTICSMAYSGQFGQAVLENVRWFLPWTVDLQAERLKLVELKNNRELELFDVVMRNLAALFLQIVSSAIKSVAAQNNEGELSRRNVLECYQHILQLSSLEDADTWASCLSAWVLYFQQQPPQITLTNVDRLIEPLVYKCVAPVQLQDINTDKEESNDTQFVVVALSQYHLPIFQQVIWNIIEKQIYVKFKQQRFEGACYCLCSLRPHISPNDKQKITNYIKLLLNVNESISPSHRRVVVDQTLNIVSFFSFILKDNPFLSQTIEQKYLENIPNSLHAMINLARSYMISQQTLHLLETKTILIQSEEGGFEGTIKNIWKVILTVEKQLFDVREATLTTDKEQILNYVLRNFAGLELFGLNWKVNWSAVQTVFGRNIEFMKAIIQQEGEHALKYAINSSHLKAHTCLIKLCCLYCKLCTNNGASVKLDDQFMSLAEVIVNNSSREQVTELLGLIS